MQPTLSALQELAAQAGKIQLAAFGQDLTIGHKGRTDLVTDVDHRVEEFLIHTIQDKFPGDQIVAEESGINRGAGAEHCWYIDPLDGTVNYAHGLPIFCVSIAYAVHNQVVLAAIFDPTRAEFFSAERGEGAWLNGSPIHVAAEADLVEALLVTGFAYDAWSNPLNNLDHFGRFMKNAQAVRRLGSAALDLCYVACGRFNGYWELKLNAWDYAAGSLIAQEAGAVVTDMAGKPFEVLPSNSIVAANPALHAQMLEVIRGASAGE